MSTTSNTEPVSIRAGETISFTKSLSDYSPPDWTLKYKIIGASGIGDATVTPGTSDYAVVFSNAVTKLIAAGIYTLYGWVEKGSGATLEVHAIYSQLLTVLADLSVVTAATDTRTTNKKILDQIETAITEYTVKPVDAISIANRTFQRPSLLTLQKLRSRYVVIVNKEIELTNRANGIAPKRILGRFGSGA